ncbi:hypothetical protein KVT40_008893 [Elsinoe batatas]|uniref:Uncharacterized protein n=1 Tax=Elsinoe batatas TaxID=2601811 RepID=A0A8K0KVB7_9PEZI|nr:hypothetical protein KVT40_008893 [Elsinoe batatas]
MANLPERQPEGNTPSEELEPFEFDNFTFAFTTKDSRFMIQYYSDLRAPSEQSQVDCLVVDVDSARLTYNDDLDRRILHCRDPKAGEASQVLLYKKLADAEYDDVIPLLAANHRYEELDKRSQSVDRVQRAMDRIRSDKVHPELHRRYWRQHARFTEAKMRILRMIRVKNEQDRQLLEANRTRIRQTVAIVAHARVAWSEEELKLATACWRRGDLGRVTDMATAKCQKLDLHIESRKSRVNKTPPRPNTKHTPKRRSPLAQSMIAEQPSGSTGTEKQGTEKVGMYTNGTGRT